MSRPESRTAKRPWSEGLVFPLLMIASSADAMGHSAYMTAIVCFTFGLIGTVEAFLTWRMSCQKNQ